MSGRDTLAVDASPAAGRRLILLLLRPHRRLLAVGVLAGLLWAGGRVAVPLLVAWAIGSGIDRGALRPVVLAALVLIGVGAVSALAAGVRRYAGESLGANVDADLRRQLFERWQQADIAYHDQMSTGELLTRSSSDIQQVRHPIMNGPLTISNVVLVLASLVALLVLDARLAVCALLPTLVVVPLTTLMVLRLGDAAQRLQTSLAETASAIQESLLGIRTVQGLGTEEVEIAKVTARASAARTAAWRVVRVRAAFLPLTDALPTLGLVVVLWVGGRAVADGTLAVGTLISVSYYVTMLVAPLRTIGMTMAMVQRASISGGLLHGILNTPQRVVDPTGPGVAAARPAPGRLAFEHVWFGYGDAPVLAGLDLVVEPGETVALVGASGAGKSTVAALAGRWYDPDRGRVTLDGHDLRDHPQAQLRRRLVPMVGLPFVFEGTVAANIAFGRPGASRGEVVAAAVTAGADAFVRSLPRGYDTVLPARGASLSGGQRQRLALARTLLTRPDVLVLDEPLSAVDARTEAEIRDRLTRYLAGTTCLLVAHRPQTLAIADRVLLLVGGRIVESGTHAELAAASELYRDTLAMAAPTSTAREASAT